MARKESITKDMLINAAFTLLCEEGADQVTARKLAAKANCSTQPIFRIYKNMDELLEELFAKACDFFQEYCGRFEKKTVAPFVHLGNIYIRFAAEHKNLFEFIFLSTERFGRSMYDLVNGSEGYVGKEIQSAALHGCQNPSELFMKMWIFIHGAACMTLTGDYDLSEDETVQMIKECYHSFR